jgi:hypothetical protein
MASFTSVGDTATLSVGRAGQTVAVALSGTYNMTIALQVEQGSPGSGAWRTIESWDTANATVAYNYVTKTHNESLRLIVLVDTSGTCTATITDATDLMLHRFEDAAGDPLVEIYESGIVNYVGQRFGDGAGVVNTTASLTLTAASHAGKTVTVNAAAGATITLPAATGTGDVYTVIVGTTITSNSFVIRVANATDSFYGSALAQDTDVDGTLKMWSADSGDDTITGNGTATGGVQGDQWILRDIASGVFQVFGQMKQSGGSEATPFSAAVS